MGYDMAKYLSTYNFDLFLVAKDKKELDKKFKDLKNTERESVKAIDIHIKKQNKNLWLRLIQRRRMYKTLQRSKKWKHWHINKQCRLWRRR